MNINLSSSINLAKIVLGFETEKGTNSNDVLSVFNTGEKSKERILSKNILLRYHWIGSRNAHRELIINKDIFNCPSCNGLGEKYIETKKEITVPCKFCDGIGSTNSECKNCEENKGVCDMCLYSSNCRSCKGKGFVNLSRSIIVRADTCSDCSGTGIEKKIINPVISKQMADKIKSKFRKK